MSKQRPSSTIREATTPVTDVTAAEPINWRQRVFKNTYTRHGRTIEVKNWSVKIQYQGIRRTVSLSAGNRLDAATEAHALYQTIVAQGWQAVFPIRHSDAAAGVEVEMESLSKTDVRYWRSRLLRRRQPSSSGQVASVEFSARIEHAGVSHYFPLTTLKEDSAAAKARDIYLMIVKEGWEAANQRFSRELTVALHWADNPLAWTYATFHTATGSALPPATSSAIRKRHRLSVILVEPDASVRRALAECVNCQPGIACTHRFVNMTEALSAAARGTLQLALVNRNTPEVATTAFPLHRITPHLPVVFFTTYEDSDQLFKATPGGASGYLLKRTSPGRLFEPIADAVNDKSLSRDRMAVYVRRYFQNVTLPLSTDSTTHDMAKLTHREHEILTLLSKGYADKEIAETLSISGWTVHGHLKRIFEKLGVHTRTEAAIRYLQK